MQYAISFVYSFFLNKFILFIYFWLHWVFIAARGLSLVVANRGYSSLWCVGFSWRWLLLLWSKGSRRAGLVAPRHVGSSWTRARIRVPCIGRWILNHCTTGEVLYIVLNINNFVTEQRRREIILSRVLL